jgi:hypothetical protein
LEFLRLILIPFFIDFMLPVVDCVVNNLSIGKISNTAARDLFKNDALKMLYNLGLNQTEAYTIILKR